MNAFPNAQPDSSLPAATGVADGLLDALPWGLMVLDEQRIIRRTNRQAARWCAARPEAVLGQTLAGACLPPAVQAALLQLLEPGETTSHEVYMASADQWLTFSVTRQSDGWVLYGQDVTERRHREAELRASEERQAFRVQLGDALHQLADPLEIQATAARVLGHYLEVDRAYYVTVGETTQEFVVTRAWHRTDTAGHPRRYPLADWPMPWLLSGQTWVCHDVDTDAALSDEQRADYRRHEVRAAVVVPLLRDEHLVATLVVNQNEPRTWTPQEVALVEETLERTWAAVERAQAEQALAASEAKYRVLFDSTNEGFTTVEVLFDEAGKAIDYRFLELNQAHEKLTGVPRSVAGKRVREIVPDIEETLLQRLERVALTGEAIRYEQYAQELGRWFDVHTSRVGGSGSRTIANVFTDITARKRREQHLAFLAELDVDFAPLLSASQIMTRVSEQLAGYLNLSRCHLAEVDATADYLNVTFDWQRETGRPTLLGRHPVADYLTAEGREHVRTGQPLVATGRESNPLISTPPAVRAAIGLGASVDIPHLINGQWRFLLTVARAEPSDWRPDEIKLLRQLAARIYTRLERAQAETTLKDAHDQLTSVLERTHDAFYSLDAELRFTYVNQQAAQLWGHERAAIIGQVYYQLFPQTLGSEVFRQHQEVFKTRQPAHFETMSPILGIWIEMSIYPGRQGGLSVFFHDISARRKAEEDLRLSEIRLSLALQAGEMGSFEWTSDGNRITLSPMSAEVLGLLPDTRIATSEAYFELLHPEDRARHQALFDEAGRTGGDFHSIYRIVRPRDEAVRWIEERGQGTLEPASSGVCLRGVHWDVTEPMLTQQRLTEFNAQLERRVARRTRELQASRDLLQSVFDTSLLGMSVLEAVRDETGAVLDFQLQLVNPELVRETGRTDLVGKLYAQEYPGIREVGIFDLAVRALETGKPHGIEYFYPHEGFNKWFSCQFVKMGDGVVGTNLDITERKTAEQERLKNLRLLEQAEAVAGLGGWDYELATGTMRWSAGMYRLFDWPATRAVSPAVYLEVVTDDDRPRAEELVRCLRTGAGGFEQTLHLHLGGQVKTVRMKAVVVHDEQQQAVRVLGVDLDISELQRLEQDNLQLRLRQQRALFEAVQAAQEAERERMAESLHNGIGQILCATKLHLDRLHGPLLQADASLRAVGRETNQLLDQAIRQTRALSHELVPMVLTEFGLTTALEDIGRNITTPQLQLRCHVLLDDAAGPLEPALQMALYRMAQELAQNIVKHARGATQATLELETMPGWVLLRAEDNGLGFVPVPPQRPGLGLRSMLDRVTLLGGQLEVGSVTTGGAYVRIRIPLSVVPFST